MGLRPHRLILLLLAFALVAGGCGSNAVESDDVAPPTSAAEAPGVQLVQVAERTGAAADPAIAGGSITAFGNDVFEAARRDTPGENLTLSPTSIAIALAMLEPGATGEAATQFADLFGIEDRETFHASMNALEQSLENRVLPDFGEDSDPGELTLRIANAAYLQQGYPFEAAYLETIGSNYGPVLNEVDFAPDPDAIAHEINDWVAEQTEDRITDLIGDGVIDPATVLALVNALYMNASWLEPFEMEGTTDSPFTLLDGTSVDLPLMLGGGDSSAQGDGWVGATKSYTGGLHIQFILPDEGRFEEIADNLTSVLAAYDEHRTSGSTLGVPRFETRSSVELSPLLQALGLTAPYAEGNLLGIANDPNLVVDKVIHETFLAIDEEGTEAAAATVVLVTATSGPAVEPVPVILDRPFLYRIVDQESGATLFIGQILDPTT